MYAVIFKAHIKMLDEAYFATAKRMRELAIARYSCLDFISTCENNQEISISYWRSEKDIRAWKEDLEHLEAQKLGQTQWYDSYEVEIVKIVQKYTKKG